MGETAVNPVLDLMRRHRSVRRYAPTPLPRALLEEAVSAAQMASTASHTQTYCVLRITDTAARERLAELCGNQRMVAEAGAFLVVCGDIRRHRLLSDRAGRPHVQNLESFLTAAVDAALFGQNLALALEARGLGICYVGGLRNRLAEVGALLELPRGVLPFFGLCAGEPAEIPGRKPRLPLAAVLLDDRYPADEEVLAALDAFDATMADHYAGRGLEGRSWSDGIVRMHEAARRGYLPAYYREQGADLGPG